MMELFFVACLQVMPGDCQEQRLPNLMERDVLSCMIQAQARLAEWAEAHPHLTITRWTCRHVPAGEREA